MWQYNRTYYYPQHMDNELYHHGILGQKWGKRNGPPYPLNFSAKSSAEKQSSSSISGGAKNKIRKIQLTDEQKIKVKKALKVAFIAAATVGAAVVGGSAFQTWMKATSTINFNQGHLISKFSNGKDLYGFPYIYMRVNGTPIYGYIGENSGNVYDPHGKVTGNYYHDQWGTMAVSALAGFAASKKVSTAVSNKLSEKDA